MSTKSPDEIKKGLEITSYDCLMCACCATDCPYDLECHPGNEETNANVPKAMLRDALALIQQLQAELEDMTARYKIADDCAKKKGEMNEKLYAELTAVKAERDAAVADLRRAMHCPSCANWKKPEKAAVCFACQYGRARRFEWRGVQKEGSDDGKE